MGETEIVEYLPLAFGMNAEGMRLSYRGAQR